jgi:hypothetical protein
MFSAPETLPFRARKRRASLLAKERLMISSSLFDIQLRVVWKRSRHKIETVAVGKAVGRICTAVAPLRRKLSDDRRHPCSQADRLAWPTIEHSHGLAGQRRLRRAARQILETKPAADRTLEPHDHLAKDAAAFQPRKTGSNIIQGDFGVDDGQEPACHLGEAVTNVAHGRTERAEDFVLLLK